MKEGLTIIAVKTIDEVLANALIEPLEPLSAEQLAEYEARMAALENAALMRGGSGESVH